MNADNATVTEPYVSLDGHNGRDSFSSSYYIKDVMVIGGNQSEVNTLPDNRAVTGITFNSMQSGAVPLQHTRLRACQQPDGL